MNMKKKRPAIKQRNQIKTGLMPVNKSPVAPIVLFKKVVLVASILEAVQVAADIFAYRPELH